MRNEETNSNPAQGQTDDEATNKNGRLPFRLSGARLSVPQNARVIQQIGHYSIVKVCRGGMGEVYLGFDERDETRRPVALKSVRQEFWFDPIVRRAFQRECALWVRASLAGPGILPVNEICVINGRRYIRMMGVLPGPHGETSLRDLLNKARPTLEEVVFYACSIAVGLASAAIVVPGLVHGDLSPSNILMPATGPCVSDFGLARAAGRLLDGDLLRGKRKYCSPLARDPKATLSVLDDVYAFGVILEEMLTARTGRRSKRRQGKNTRESDTATLVRQGLVALARRCRCENPELRPGSFDVVEQELGRIAPEEEWPIPEAVNEALEELKASRQVEIEQTYGSVEDHALILRVSIIDALIDLEEYAMTLDLIYNTKPQKRYSWLLRMHRGEALQGLNYPSKAARSYCRALLGPLGEGVLHPAFARYTALAGLAESSRRLGRFRRGKAYAGLVIAKCTDEDVVAQAVNTLATIYTETRNYRRAEWLLREVQTKTDRAEHWGNLGTIYCRLGEFEQAVDMYQRALEFDQGRASLYADLGEALMRIPDRIPDAYESFCHAIGCGVVDFRTATSAFACAWSTLQDDDEIARLRATLLQACDPQSVWMYENFFSVNLAKKIIRGQLGVPPRAASDYRWERRKGRRSGRKGQGK
jgi:serine/threonine protein kinase